MKYSVMMYTEVQSQREASRGVSCTQEQDPYRAHLYRRKKTDNNSNEGEYIKCAHVNTVHRFAPAYSKEKSEQLFPPIILKH